MPNIFLSAAVCFFALFGIIQMFKCIINEILKCRNDFFIVISVKNQQDCIEDIIRTTVFGGRIFRKYMSLTMVLPTIRPKF